jgi:NADH dehydrogenase
MVRQIRRVLARQPLLPFAYRDFGSLVTLGKYGTVGGLMGFLIGRNFFVEGYFARLMYRSLYAMHQRALYGWSRVVLGILGRGLAHGAEPHVKLH